MARTPPLLSGAAMSLLVHAGATLALITLPSARSLHKELEPKLHRLVDVEPVETVGGGADRSRVGQRPFDAALAEAGGSTSRQNIDGRDPGVGGDVTGALSGIRLMIEDDRVLLFDSPLNNLAAAQLQRIRTANDQATLERRRATPHPDDQAFLASGNGDHRERRPVSEVDARSGARIAPVASMQGALPSEPRPGSEALRGAGADPGAPGAAAAASGPAGTDQASPGRGILDGRGPRPSERARVAFGRPAVDEGPAATIAHNSDARVRDNQDSEELARSMVEGWIDATARTSRREGPGRGGIDQPGPPGSGGGMREGGRAEAWGPGNGPFAALDTNDARYRRWVRDTRRRIMNALRFPRQRALAMDQGTTIYVLSVHRDGRLNGSPRLVRSSGFDDLDAAALSAIRAATPFAPVPADLAPTLAQIPIRLPVDFINPMVQ